MNEFKKKIELINRELKCRGSILNFYEDIVKVDGNTAHWDYIEKCHAAAIVPVLPNGNIVMVRQFRLAVDEYTLEIPAGKLDSDEEDFIVCAKRELEEETGYKSDNLNFLCDTYTAAAFCNEIVRIFIATDLKKGETNFDRDEELLIEEWNEEDLKKEIYAGKIKDGKTIAGLMAYFNKIK